VLLNLIVDQATRLSQPPKPISMEGLVIVSNNILFPGKAQPSPGTIVVDEETGKIHEVLEHKVAQYTLDAGDLWVLPGLVE